MLSVSNTTPSGASQAVATGSAYVNGTGTGYFLWCATAQDLTAQGVYASVSLTASRTSTTCYMRGLSENLRIQTSSGLPWFHRRICFTYKGDNPFLSQATADTATVQSVAPFIETSNGMQRLWLNASVNNQPNTQNERNGVIFKGAQGVDWNDAITAPLDTARITVRYDVTRTIKSGNNNGTVMERKLWHGMNKNLVYDDDESGQFETTKFTSVESKAGMGDYYVYDIVQPGIGGTSSDLVAITSSATLYWHEK